MNNTYTEYLRENNIPYRITRTLRLYVPRVYEWQLNNDGISYRIVDEKYIEVGK